jgi:hypothetical protein
MNRYTGRKSEDKIDYLYVLLAFALSVTFFILLLAKKNSNEDDLLYDYNMNIYQEALAIVPSCNKAKYVIKLVCPVKVLIKVPICIRKFTCP